MLKPYLRLLSWRNWKTSYSGQSVSAGLVQILGGPYVVDVAEEVAVWLYAPVVVVRQHPRVFVEESAVPPTHVTIADHPPFAHANHAQVFETVHKTLFIDPVRRRPVLLGDLFEIAFGRREV